LPAAGSSSQVFDETFEEGKARRAARKRQIEQASLASYLSERLQSDDPQELSQFQNSLLSGDPATLKIATELGIVLCCSLNGESKSPPSVEVYQLNEASQVEARNRLIKAFAYQEFREAYQNKTLAPRQEFELTKDLVTVATATSWDRGPSVYKYELDQPLKDCIRHVNHLDEKLQQGLTASGISDSVSQPRIMGHDGNPQNLKTVGRILRDRVENSVFPDSVSDDRGQLCPATDDDRRWLICARLESLESNK
jgi:hypothetical protein